MMTYPYILSIPHCGSRVPSEIRPLMALDDSQIMDAKDWGSDVLFQHLPVRKVLKAEFSRLVADLNRAPHNRGPKGVVARTDYRGRQIYKPGKYPDEESIEQRVRTYHSPYHERLRQALAEPGITGIFDCHSLNGTGPVDAPDAGEKRRDIILSNNGNRQGGPDPEVGGPTCPQEVIETVATAFSAAGFSVSINTPYQGGYITVHYGRQLFAQGRFAIQVEMNQDLYLDKQGPGLDAEKVKHTGARISRAFARIAASLAP